MDTVQTQSKHTGHVRYWYFLPPDTVLYHSFFLKLSHSLSFPKPGPHHSHLDATDGGTVIEEEEHKLWGQTDLGFSSGSITGFLGQVTAPELFPRL